MSSASGKSHFRTIQSFTPDYAPASITQYVSERTGMSVVVVNQKGPKVTGYFALATEIFDDSGSPHTLEHLCFMGSKNYQYKGLLDKLGTRAYSFTNAWTANDHTAYTLDTAGWEGFALILPVYLEHILLPTLTDEGCYTEVHHIDGDGNDAGVVYSEMQGIENVSSSILDERMNHLLYPKNSGFRYHTGGLMEKLRVLKADRIREFHKEMYQPRNLCLILVGEVDQDNLLQVLDDFEGSILNDIPSPTAPFKRPWIDSAQPPPLKETVVETVEFPEEDESMGELLVGFFGPDCNDELETSALTTLLTYLAGSSVSILENVMVEKEQLASQIGFWWDARPNSVIYLKPTGVATDKLASVEQRLFELLKQVASTPLDLTYMHDCLHRERRQIKSQAEGSDSYYADNIINDFVFGKRDGSTLKTMATMKEFDILETWTEEQWKDFLKKWLSDAHHISLLGKPSKALALKIKADEEARLASRREELGPEGMKKLREALAAAVAKNEREIPDSVLRRWPVPGVESIHFIKSITARSGLAKSLGTESNDIQEIIDQKNSEVPLFLHFEHVPTNFVHINLLLGTSEIPKEYRPLLAVFLNNFLETPIIRNGQKIEFEQVVTELEKDTIAYSMGSSAGDAEGIAIKFQIEPEKYATAIEWIRTLIFDSVFDEARLKATVSKILANIPSAKRKGSSMAWQIDTMLHLDNESSVKARNTLVKAVYMKRLKKMLTKEPETVISWLKIVRQSLFTFNNMRAMVIANVEKLPNPVDAWKPLIASLDTSRPLLPLIKQHALLSDNGKALGKYGVVVVPMPTENSSFCVATAKGPTSFHDPIIPSLVVALSFLEVTEGPLWVAIRGTGLAYGANFSKDLDCGFVQFSIGRSPDAFRAFVAGKKVIQDYIDGTLTIEASALEGSVSNIVVSLADEQSTMAAAASVNFINSVIRGLPADYSAQMLKSVKEVTVDEIKACMRDVLLPAFEAGTSNVVITCAPGLEEQISKGFTDLGFETQSQPLSAFHDDYGLQADEDEDEEEEEDEDEGSDDDSHSHGSQCDHDHDHDHDHDQDHDDDMED